VGPEIFHFKFAAMLSRGRQRQQFHAGRKSIGHIAQDLTRNFTAPALRFQHAGQRDELVSFLRLARIGFSDVGFPGPAIYSVNDFERISLARVHAGCTQQCS
jgi:hypothetical protein